MEFIELKMLLYEKYAILVFYVSDNFASDLTFQSAWLPFPEKARAAQILGHGSSMAQKLYQMGSL